jgi:uncharacterized membrane protein
VLSTVAAATITFASITFSVALLVMQQGSAQLSPRVIPGLTRDPFNRRVIAVVVGTFTYCLVVLQRVRSPLDPDGEAIVASFAVALGLFLGLAAVLCVVAAIHHTASQMDVSKILDDIVRQASRTSFHELPEDLDVIEGEIEEPTGPCTNVRAETAGWVREVDIVGLLGNVRAGDVVRIEVATGRYVILGTVLATVWSADGGPDVARLRAAVRIGPTRTMLDDRSYGIRQVVDIGLKALSPGVNDPTTAQDAIFHLGTLLVRSLQTSPLARAYRAESGGMLLVPQAMSDEDLAGLALSELRRAAAHAPAVAVYLMEMVSDVLEAADAAPARTAPLRRQMELLMRDIDHAGLPSHDLAMLRTAYRRRFGEIPGMAAAGPSDPG